MSPDCPQFGWPDDASFFGDLFRRAQAARVPLSGTLELTRRCNLRCVHCYLGPQARVRREAGREMTTAQVLALIDEWAAAGCLSLLITGGDPLLRQDFSEVYRHAKLAGLDVTVFSNGTTIRRRHVELFQDLPPRAVEITLYGATAATYERITGVPGSFRRCLEGMRRLTEGGVRLELKTMLMTLNRHEFAAIEDVARGLGCKFRFDPLLNARFDGDREPLALRVDPGEVVRLELADETRREAWLGLSADNPEIQASEQVIQCWAGVTGFYVDAYGTLQPCVMLPWLSHRLAGSTFAEGWARLAGLTGVRARADNQCVACQKRPYCGYCPGLLWLENGDPEIASDYQCALGAERLRAITAYSERS